MTEGQPPDEAARIASLHGLNILDTPPEYRFDRITDLAAQIFDVPIALVTLVDTDRQWFKSCIGLDVAETSREISFCRHVVLSAEPMIITDALADERFVYNPLVTGPPGIRFYAGAPLADPAGRVLGTLCIIDVRPRPFDASQLEILKRLAGWVAEELRTIGLDRTTQLLAQSAALHRSVVAAIEEGVVVRDQTGAVVACNASAERILGLKAAQMIGRATLSAPWRAVDAAGEPLTDEDLPASVALRTGEPASGVIVGVHRPDAILTWIAVNAQPLLHPGESRPYASVASFADITERRDVERIKSELISVVSHELRTPLAAVRGALGLIAEGETGEIPDRASRMVAIAMSNTDRLLRLINEMLDVERLESGRARLVRRELEPGVLLRQAVEAMQPLADRHGVTMLAASTSARAWADPDQILQTLTNLIGNAIKFSPAGATVRLGATDEGSMSVFRVSDEGPGIPEHMLEPIFDRFQQVNASDAREKGGTGLGLAICRGILQQHGQRIWAESVLGEGSTFTFTLPIASEPDAPATSDAPTPPGTAH